jgi:rfaE bifunctional protein nucleotidyltransferase chain/domain
MTVVSGLSNSKTLTLEELAQVVADLRQAGKVVAHCHGVFDLMHVGHIRHFEQAKQLGDVLIVTVTPDRFVNKGPNRPVFPEAQRAWSIAALACVDYVAINQWPMATDTIRLLKPDVFVKGTEFRNLEDRTGAVALEEQAIREVGGCIKFAGDVVFSSSSLLNRHFNIFSKETERFLHSFSSRYTSDDVIRSLERARGLRVLVLGEAIVDEYQYCETLGKTGKEPVLAARHISSERFAGGSLAVANHVTAVCDRVSVLTLLGTIDSHEQFIREHLRPSVEKIFLYIENAPTIVKRRFLESYPLQKLFEVYVMADVGRLGSQSLALCEKLDALLPEYDVVVVADYGHGMISHEVADLLSAKARFLAINTQVNAGNQGFNTVSKYRRANFISISEKEIRMEARNPEGDLRTIVRDVSVKLSCDRMIITCGVQGCLCYSREENFCETPAFSARVVDRVGAGDAVLAITAPCAAVETPSEVLSFIAGCVGAQAVTTVGNRTAIERVSLARYVECLMK